MNQVQECSAFLDLNCLEILKRTWHYAWVKRWPNDSNSWRDTMNPWLVLADLVALLHAAYVVFVVAGVFLIVVGGLAGWRFVTHLWFRLIHLAAICVVGLEAVLGWSCPLTVLENVLRIQGGQIGYGGSFLGYWLHHLLYPERIPESLFDVGHVTCALLVSLLWFLVPPRRPAGP